MGGINTEPDVRRRRHRFLSPRLLQIRGVEADQRLLLQMGHAAHLLALPSARAGALAQKPLSPLKMALAGAAGTLRCSTRGAQSSPWH